MLLKWQVKKLGFQLNELWHEEECARSGNYKIRQEKEKKCGRMSEKIEMTRN